MAHGFRKGRLEAIERFLSEHYIGRGRLPCAQLLIARGGEVAHQSVQGHADLAQGRSLQDDAVFRIYSMTKPITSVALMMLVEEGLVALDDPVHTAKTGFLTRPTERAMTVLDLLRHTSGLTYGFQMQSNVDAAYRRAGIGEIEKAGLRWRRSRSNSRRAVPGAIRSQPMSLATSSRRFPAGHSKPFSRSGSSGHWAWTTPDST